MPDREKVIKDLEECLSASCRGFRPRLSCPYNDDEWDIMRDALSLLKEQEAATEYVINEYQPTCKACGFRPFSGYIPSLEWMREREFKFCPHCGRKVKWE